MKRPHLYVVEGGNCHTPLTDGIESMLAAYQSISTAFKNCREANDIDIWTAAAAIGCTPAEIVSFEEMSGSTNVRFLRLYSNYLGIKLRLKPNPGCPLTRKQLRKLNRLIS